VLRATGIAVVTQFDPISVIFTVPENQVPQIVGRFQSDASLPVVVFDRGNSGESARAPIQATDRMSSAQSGLNL
jgi:membrane fusion protein, multidrug efflux system